MMSIAQSRTLPQLIAHLRTCIGYKLLPVSPEQQRQVIVTVLELLLEQRTGQALLAKVVEEARLEPICARYQRGYTCETEECGNSTATGG